LFSKTATPIIFFKLLSGALNFRVIRFVVFLMPESDEHPAIKDKKVVKKTTKRTKRVVKEQFLIKLIIIFFLKYGSDFCRNSTSGREISRNFHKFRLEHGNQIIQNSIDQALIKNPYISVL
jgi:hypothetical protein